MKNKSTLLFIVIAIACLALGVGAVVLARNYVPDITGPTGADNYEKAQIRCEEVVRRSLRSSDQGKFRNSKVTALGENRYQVTGIVDAPNPSGIIVRGNYICTFNFNTKTFDLLSLEGDDIWKPLNQR